MGYDDLAARVSAEYELLLMALEGRYQRIRGPGVVVTPRAINELQRDALGLTQTFLNIANAELTNYVNPMLADASEELAAHLIYRKRVCVAYLRSITHENVAQVAKAARTGIQGVTSLLKQAHGAMGVLVQARAGRIDFKATDTNGRRWPAQALVRVVVRDCAYQCYVDAEAAEYQTLGLDEVQTSKGPISLDDLNTHRNRLFHPNATTTILEPHVHP